jgi:carbon-monoxide dehydrogenase large subunit
MAIFVIERLIDIAAREMNMDPAEIRRRNLISPDMIPYQSPLNLIHDSANYAAVLSAAIETSDWRGFEARKRSSRRRGKLRGRGIAYFMEICGPYNDRMEIRFDEGGCVTVVAGTHSHGQGHETVYAQMIADWLGVDFGSVGLIQGDTDRVEVGRGTFGSRSMVIGGSALLEASRQIVENGRRMAAHVLEAAIDDISFDKGNFEVVGTDKTISIVELAKLSFAPIGWPAELGMGLAAVGTFTPTNSNHPNGCHVAEVEIDPETGAVALARYTAVEDSGVVINPLLYGGQIHGGLAMGVGQALLEKIAFDADSGQMLSGSFLDYAMPRADDMPDFELHDVPDPCHSNPLGVKGAGESGTVGAPPTIINAIVDALADFGVRDVEMPATSERVWRAIHGS